MKRLVYLPQGRQITLGNYVRAWKLALTAPEGTIFNKALAHYDRYRIPTPASMIISGNLKLIVPHFNSISLD